MIGKECPDSGSVIDSTVCTTVQLHDAENEGARSVRQSGKVYDGSSSIPAFPSLSDMESPPKKVIIGGVREITFIPRIEFAVPALGKDFDAVLQTHADLAQQIVAPTLGLLPSATDDGTYGGLSRLTQLRANVAHAICGGSDDDDAQKAAATDCPIAVQQVLDPAHPLRLERPSSEPAVTAVYTGAELSNGMQEDPVILGVLFGVVRQVDRSATSSEYFLSSKSAEMSDSDAPSRGSELLPDLESLLAYQPGGTDGEPAAISHVPLIRSGRYVLDVSSRCSPAAFVTHFETVWGPLHRQALACPRSVVGPAAAADVAGGSAQTLDQLADRAKGPNVRWHSVVLAGRFPFLVLATIPGCPLVPGTELLCDKGPSWFRQHSRLRWPPLFAEFLNFRGCAAGDAAALPGLLLGEVPRRLVCAGCGESVAVQREKLFACDACKLHHHLQCLQERRTDDDTRRVVCASCVHIAGLVYGIGDGFGSACGAASTAPSSGLDLVRGDEEPFSRLTPCKECASANASNANNANNANVQCRLRKLHVNSEVELRRSLEIAALGLAAAEDRNASLARKAAEVRATAMFPNMSEADLQEAVEQWNTARLKAKARGNVPPASSLLVPHIPLVDPQAAEAAAMTVYRSRAAASADDEDSEVPHYSEDEDDEEDEDEDGSALADSDDGQTAGTRRYRRSSSSSNRPHGHMHASIEGGPQSVARELLGEEFEPPAGAAVLIEGSASITEANNKARDLRPWPRGVSWNGKRLTWSVRFWAPGGLRLLSTSLPARKHGGVEEAFRKAVTLRTRSYSYVLARVANETLKECGNAAPAIWEPNRWRVTGPDGSTEVFEALAEPEVRNAFRQAFLWLREKGDPGALSMDPAAVDSVVNRPRPAPLPEGPAHELPAAAGALAARSKRSRLTGEEIDVLPPPDEVLPCGQNLSLPSPYYSQDLAVMTAEMEAEVRQLPENDKVKWYRQKRGFNASIYGQSKWFSAYSRGVQNAYLMAVAWLERKRAEAAGLIPKQTESDDYPRCSSGGSNVAQPAGARRSTRSSRYEATRQQQQQQQQQQPQQAQPQQQQQSPSEECYDSGSFSRSKPPAAATACRAEKPLNPGVRQMMDLADQVQHDGQWDSDDSAADANEQARRLPKISNICWVPQKQAFSVFYTKDPSHSSKTTKAFNPQYYGGVKRSFRQALLFAFAMQLRLHPSWRSREAKPEEEDEPLSAAPAAARYSKRPCTP